MKKNSSSSLYAIIFGLPALATVIGCIFLSWPWPIACGIGGIALVPFALVGRWFGRKFPQSALMIAPISLGGIIFMIYKVSPLMVYNCQIDCYGGFFVAFLDLIVAVVLVPLAVIFASSLITSAYNLARQNDE